jgi:nitroimidazol reductase NimA-like FMN-containing flavoprotein (pyridoxamine 5'-phosphate oxidase superfamily)
MMRRNEREITDMAEKIAVIDRCKVCRLGVSENDQAYVVPLNFGYTVEGGALTLYFHGAREGKKIDILKNNNKACFEIDCDYELLEADTACGYGFAFASVIGFGTVEFISGNAEKIRALNILMKHQTGRDIQHRYKETALDAVTVYKLNVSACTGKRKTAAP